MNNKADVMGVLTQSEREDIAGGNEQDHLRSSAYDNIETILKARLTDLQSAHDVEKAELEKKVMEAIPRNDNPQAAMTDFTHGYSTGWDEVITKITQSVRDAFKNKEEGI
jgi:hypothetical protein